MSIKSKLIILLGVLVAGVLKVSSDLGAFKKVETLTTYNHCRYLPIDMIGPEDMQEYRNNTIIVISGNYPKLWAHGTPEMEQMGVYAIYNSDQTDYYAKQLRVIGFPKGVALYFHGITINYEEDGDYLYAVNHAYAHGGERIEIFRFEKIQDDELSLIYINSLQMDPTHNGVLNDLIALSNERLLVTKYIAYPDAINGRKYTSGSDNFKILFSQLTGREYTYVLDCKIQKNGKQTTLSPKCKIIDSTYTTMANGITWNGRDRIWVAESLYSGMKEYRIIDNKIEFLRFIDLKHGVDNLYYDAKRNVIYAGLAPIATEFLTLVDYLKNNPITRDSKLNIWGSVAEYNLDKEELTFLAQSQSLPKGTSVAILKGPNLYIGSWGDITVMVCNNNKH